MEKICNSCGNKFNIDTDEINFYNSKDIPVSEKCYICNWKQLLAFWIFGKFRKTKSDVSSKDIITILPSTIKFPLCSFDEWANEVFNPLSYGMDFDFNRKFFEQFFELQQKVPHPHQSGTKNINSEWCDDAWNSKNCYLSRSILECENLIYGYRNVKCKDSVDLVFSFNTEQSYSSTYLFNCYNVLYSFNARDSINSYFLYDCHNVSNCFMCWNLRNKQYHILNKPYSKEEYFKQISQFNLGSYKVIASLKKKFLEIIKTEAIHRENYNINALNSDGNFIEESRNCKQSYLIQKSENSKYIFRGFQNKDVIYSAGSFAENSIFSVMDGKMYNTISTIFSNNCRDSFYLDHCDECENCFGCVGLRKKKYCILNKQYSEKEYFDLFNKIKEHMKKTGEWGKFFPSSIAYCGYNLSTADIYFSQDKETALNFGFRWDDVTESEVSGITEKDIPDDIDDVSNDFYKQAIICQKTNWRFNVSSAELEFYKNKKIPIPHYHFDFRIKELLNFLNQIKPVDGQCYFCKKSIKHFYPLEWGYQKITCIDCYHSQVL
jgi:hypothetical protein